MVRRTLPQMQRFLAARGYTPPSRALPGVQPPAPTRFKPARALPEGVAEGDYYVDSRGNLIQYLPGGGRQVVSKSTGLATGDYRFEFSRGERGAREQTIYRVVEGVRQPIAKFRNVQGKWLSVELPTEEIPIQVEAAPVTPEAPVVEPVSRVETVRVKVGELIRDVKGRIVGRIDVSGQEITSGGVRYVATDDKGKPITTTPPPTGIKERVVGWAKKIERVPFKERPVGDTAVKVTKTGVETTTTYSVPVSEYALPGGAQVSERQAKQLAADLRSQGFTARWSASEVDGKVVYTVTGVSRGELDVEGTRVALQELGYSATRVTDEGFQAFKEVKEKVFAIPAKLIKEPSISDVELRQAEFEPEKYLEKRGISTANVTRQIEKLELKQRLEFSAVKRARLATDIFALKKFEQQRAAVETQEFYRGVRGEFEAEYKGWKGFFEPVSERTRKVIEYGEALTGAPFLPTRFAGGVIKGAGIAISPETYVGIGLGAKYTAKSLMGREKIDVGRAVGLAVPAAGAAVVGAVVTRPVVTFGEVVGLGTAPTVVSAIGRGGIARLSMRFKPPKAAVELEKAPVRQLIIERDLLATGKPKQVKSIGGALFEAKAKEGKLVGRLIYETKIDLGEALKIEPKIVTQAGVKYRGFLGREKVIPFGDVSGFGRAEVRPVELVPAGYVKPPLPEPVIAFGRPSVIPSAARVVAKPVAKPVFIPTRLPVVKWKDVGLRPFKEKVVSLERGVPIITTRPRLGITAPRWVARREDLVPGFPAYGVRRGMFRYSAPKKLKGKELITGARFQEIPVTRAKLFPRTTLKRLELLGVAPERVTAFRGRAYALREGKAVETPFEAVQVVKPKEEVTAELELAFKEEKKPPTELFAEGVGDVQVLTATREQVVAAQKQLAKVPRLEADVGVALKKEAVSLITKEELKARALAVERVARPFAGVGLKPKERAPPILPLAEKPPITLMGEGMEEFRLPTAPPAPMIIPEEIVVPEQIPRQRGIQEIALEQAFRVKAIPRVRTKPRLEVIPSVKLMPRGVTVPRVIPRVKAVPRLIDIPRVVTAPRISEIVLPRLTLRALQTPVMRTRQIVREREILKAPTPPPTPVTVPPPPVLLFPFKKGEDRKKRRKRLEKYWLRKKKTKFVLEPIADLLSISLTTARTFRPARSPSVVTARKYFARTLGLRVPTAEMLKGFKKRRKGGLF